MEQERGHVVRSVYGLDDLAAGQNLLDQLIALAREVADARIDVFRSLETPGLVQLYEAFPNADAATRFRQDSRTGQLRKAWLALAGDAKHRSEWRGIALSQADGLPPQAGDYFVNPLLRAKPGEVEAIAADLREDVAGMHQAGRIVYFELNVSLADPLDLMLSARWCSQAHWAAHQDQIDYTRLLDRLDGGLVRSLWEAIDTGTPAA